MPTLDLTVAYSGTGGGWTYPSYSVGVVDSTPNAYASVSANAQVYLTFSIGTSALPADATIVGVQVSLYNRDTGATQYYVQFSGGTKVGPAQGASTYTYVVIGAADNPLGTTTASDLTSLTVWATRATSGYVVLSDVKVSVTYTVGPPDPNAPVTTKLYPNGVKNVGSFSNAANLVGSSQTAATNTLSLDAVASIYTDLLLNFSTIPAGAVISTVVAKVKAKTSASNTRRLANVLADDYYTTGGGSSKAFDLGSVQLTTTETTYSKSLTWAELTATIPEAKLRDANMVFGINVWGNGSTTTTATTTISGFWLEVTYTLPSGGVNALFLGEMF